MRVMTSYSMAAPITRTCVSCYSGIRAFRVFDPVFCLRGLFYKVQPNFYGTRAAGGDADTQLHIPVDRLKTSYCRSSGPGGQNVNRVNTKTEVRFHVLTADWIPEDIRKKITLQNKNLINKKGELLVKSEISRSQQKNLADCIEKIAAIIALASKKEYEPTEEDLAVQAFRFDKDNKDRLRKKKKRSDVKQFRRLDYD